MATLAPLVVDLDGTLTPTDTLAESVIQLIRQNPLHLLRLPFWFLKGRAAFKNAVCTHLISLLHICPGMNSFWRICALKKKRGGRLYWQRQQIEILRMPFRNPLDCLMKYSPVTDLIISKEEPSLKLFKKR